MLKRFARGCINSMTNKKALLLVGGSGELGQKIITKF